MYEEFAKVKLALRTRMGFDAKIGCRRIGEIADRHFSEMGVAELKSRAVVGVMGSAAADAASKRRLGGLGCARDLDQDRRREGARAVVAREC